MKNFDKFILVFLSLVLFGVNRCFAADKTYVVKEDILHIYNQIQPTIPEPTSNHDFSNDPKGLIYGNVVTGHPAAANSKWVQIQAGFVAARGLAPEVAYKNLQGQFLIVNDDVVVYLLPESQSKNVLKLLKGEVLPVTGVYSGGSGTWYRFQFKSEIAETYAGEIPERFGWINSKDVLQLEPNMNQGVLLPVEIPKTVRGDGRVYSGPEIKWIAKKGFYSKKLDKVPNHLWADDMADLYWQIRGPVILTSDFYLHSFHLIFDRMLQDIEMKKLLPSLRDLTLKMYQISESRFNSATTDSIRNAAKRNMWYFGVGNKLMDENFVLSPAIKGDVDAEVQKIMNTDVALPSMDNPSQGHEYLPGFKEDYTQYKPRGHFTLNKDLETYFRVMMHFGRKTFLLKDPSCTLSAILMTQDLRASNLLSQWETLSVVIDQLVGETDDPSPKDYLVIMDKTFSTQKGEGKTEEPWYEKAKSYVKEKFYTEPAKTGEFRKDSEPDFSNQERLSQFIERAKKDLPPQRIVSQQTREPDGSAKTQAERIAETTGFKFFGQRYTADAEFFQRLTSPNVGSDASPKNLPSALEVMALLGSKEASDLIPKEWWKSVDNYTKAFQTTKSEVVGYPPSKWDESAYMGWLYSLNALFLPPESKQYFVIAGAWGYKTLNTALASWTELKHDTILYAEQSYAESGEGGNDGPFSAAAYAPPSIKGYIEPVPTFFNRLANMNTRIIQLLGQSNYLTDEYKNKLTTFGELTGKAEGITKKEVSGQQISEDEYAWIRGLPRRFDRGLLLPEGTGDIVEQKYLQMALIADVATDAFDGRVLTEAVGYPQELHVLVKDYWGGTRIAKGYIYTQYEFVDTKRWNDEEWKGLVYSPERQQELDKMEHSWAKEFQKPLSD